ncbi:MAG: dUTP diphosphatase [Alphaproteobacteria bacterium]|nr:dUTP diphosphatase [Alphaproteobacteria bacterium]
MTENIRIAAQHPRYMPTYATPGSVGLDIVASLTECVTIAQHETVKIPCGFSMELPAHLEAQIRPRSGLSAKHGLTVLNSPGTIDPDYRGEVCVLLHNTSQQVFSVEDGMRIAQMVIAPIVRVSVVPTTQDTLSISERNEKGFGSSGI